MTAKGEGKGRPGAGWTQAEAVQIIDVHSKPGQADHNKDLPTCACDITFPKWCRSYVIL